jgi:hypothetical protein
MKLHAQRKGRSSSSWLLPTVLLRRRISAAMKLHLPKMLAALDPIIQENDCSIFGAIKSKYFLWDSRCLH